MTAPAGSEDAGLVLSAEEREVLEVGCALFGWATQREAMEAVRRAVESIIAARVEAARAEAVHGATIRVRRLAESHAVTERARGRGDAERDWLDVLAVLDQDAARIARTPPPAGDDERGGA